MLSEKPKAIARQVVLLQQARQPVGAQLRCANAQAIHRACPSVYSIGGPVGRIRCLHRNPTFLAAERAAMPDYARRANPTYKTDPTSLPRISAKHRVGSKEHSCPCATLS
jgi:hypothetical protein